jgi:hypothetical protein
MFKIFHCIYYDSAPSYTIKNLMHVIWGSITVPSTSRQTGLELAVVDVNKKLLYFQVKLSYWEVDVT